MFSQLPAPGRKLTGTSGHRAHSALSASVDSLVFSGLETDLEDVDVHSLGLFLQNHTVISVFAATYIFAACKSSLQS